MTDNTNTIDTDEGLPNGDTHAPETYIPAGMTEVPEHTPGELVEKTEQENNTSDQSCDRPSCPNKADWKITQYDDDDNEVYSYLCQHHALELEPAKISSMILEPTWAHGFTL